MPSNETFNPSRAAVQVGVPGSTLRHWAKVYGEFLSAGSNPKPGTDRRFTAGDIETLKAVAQLRANGLQPEEIIARLRDNPAEAQQNALEAPQGENIQLAPIESSLANPVSMANVLADKLESVDRRLERVESNRRQIMLVVVAFAAGALFVSLITWLLSMLR